MSDATGSSDDGEDYHYGEAHVSESRRYPVHDCCEFDDAEALRVSAAEALPTLASVRRFF